MILNTETLELVQHDIHEIFDRYRLSNGEIMVVLDSIKTFEMAEAIIAIINKNKEK